MDLISWNMAYWLRRKHHDAAWRFLREELRPDIALLQEVRPPNPGPQESLIFTEIHNGWGTAIYSRKFSLREISYDSEYPGRAVLAEFTLWDQPSIVVTSIHAPIISNRVFPHLSRIIDEITSLVANRPAIMGGDLNTARLAEAVWPNHGHGPFFEAMDESSYVNVVWRLVGVELQTYFRNSSRHPFQDDHIFVTEDLEPRLLACEVIHNSEIETMSDHAPLRVQMDDH